MSEVTKAHCTQDYLPTLSQSTESRANITQGTRWLWHCMAGSR